MRSGNIGGGSTDTYTSGHCTCTSLQQVVQISWHSLTRQTLCCQLKKVKSLNQHWIKNNDLLFLGYAAYDLLKKYIHSDDNTFLAHFSIFPNIEVSCILWGLYLLMVIFSYELYRTIKHLKSQLKKTLFYLVLEIVITQG